MQSQKSNQNNEIHVAVYGSHDGKGKRWELSGNKNDPNFKKSLKEAVRHPPKQRYPRFEQQRNPFSNVVFGDHDTDIVKVDWDERGLVEVKRFSMLMNNRHGLDGFIILQSSSKLHKVRSEDLTKIAYAYKTKSYHTVFNRKVSREELQSILAWLCLLTKDVKLITWFLLQLIKGTYTLRIGFKGKKKPPRIVYRYGNQDKQIAKFLANREFILDFLRDAELGNGD
jgi:hypothetical protein